MSKVSLRRFYKCSTNNGTEVVEDARENFALSAPQSTALPPLPVSPIPQRARSGRVLRDTPPVSQIFMEENMKSLNDSTITNSSYLDQSSNDVSRTSSQALSSSESPQRRRRATVSTRSPEPVCSLASRSESYLTKGTHVAEKLQSHIATLSLLEAELNKRECLCSMVRCHTDHHLQRPSLDLFQDSPKL
jgi:serine/threonine-protein kinase GIN4